MHQQSNNSKRLSPEAILAVEDVLSILKVKHIRFLSTTGRALAAFMQYGFDINSLTSLLRLTAQYSAVLLLERARPGLRPTVEKRNRILNPAERRFVTSCLDHHNMEFIEAARWRTDLRRFQRALQRVLSEYDGCSEQLSRVHSCQDKGFQEMRTLVQRSSDVLDVILAANQEDSGVKREQRYLIVAVADEMWYRCHRYCWKEVSELINAWLTEATFPSTPLFVSPESLRMVLVRVYNDFRIKHQRSDKTAALAQFNHSCYGHSVMKENHLDNIQIAYDIAGVLKNNGFRTAGTSIQKYIKSGLWNEEHARELIEAIRQPISLWRQEVRGQQAHAGELKAVAQYVAESDD